MSRRQLFRALVVLLVMAGVLVWAVHCCQITLDRLAGKLGKPLMRLTLAIALGLLVGMFIENAKVTARLGRFFAPLLRFGHLREPSAAAFTAAFFSAVTASTVLMSAYQEGRITRRELMLSGLILTFPAFFAHLPSMFFTITPLVGVLGVYYLAILLGGDLLRTLAYLLYGRLTLPASEPKPQQAAERRASLGEIWQNTRKKFLQRLYNILLITVPVFVAVFLAQEGGLFQWLNRQLGVLLRGTPLPAEALSILVFSLAAEATGGFAAAGALLAAKALSPGMVLFTLILGTILSSPMRALRHQLPFYLGVYTPALGLRLMVLSQFFRVLSLLPFLGLIYLCAL